MNLGLYRLYTPANGLYTGLYGLYKVYTETRYSSVIGKELKRWRPRLQTAEIGAADTSRRRHARGKHKLAKRENPEAQTRPARNMAMYSLHKVLKRTRQIEPARANSNLKNSYPLSPKFKVEAISQRVIEKSHQPCYAPTLNEG